MRESITKQGKMAEKTIQTSISGLNLKAQHMYSIHKYTQWMVSEERHSGCPLAYTCTYFRVKDFIAGHSGIHLYSQLFGDTG